jgi:putative endonuclease
MSWYVYIAEARTGRYYTGVTTDPARRMNEHNEGRGSKFSKDQGSLALLYVSSAFQDKSAAWKREMQIKGWSRVKKAKLIRGEWK